MYGITEANMGLFTQGTPVSTTNDITITISTRVIRASIYFWACPLPNDI